MRCDSHAHAGYTVPPYYDSMIGKLIVHRPTREEAIACMLRALGELRIEGIKTTAPFHKQVLSHATFAEGHGRYEVRRADVLSGRVKPW